MAKTKKRSTKPMTENFGTGIPGQYAKSVRSTLTPPQTPKGAKSKKVKLA